MLRAKREHLLNGFAMLSEEISNILKVERRASTSCVSPFRRNREVPDRANELTHYGIILNGNQCTGFAFVAASDDIECGGSTIKQRDNSVSGAAQEMWALNP